MSEEKKHALVDPATSPDGGPTVPGIRDVFATVLKTVTSGITSAAKGTEPAGAALLGAVTEVVKSAVQEAVKIGSDLVPGTKAIIMGVVRGTGEKSEAGLKVLSHAAKTVIRQTADVGGDLAAATKGLVLGAIASAKNMGVDSAKAASTAALGALQGAKEAGSVTVERVLAALKEPIGGSKVAIPNSSQQ